eukprot:13721841-Alexandrium_andersonii.AAC.1
MWKGLSPWQVRNDWVHKKLVWRSGWPAVGRGLGTEGCLDAQGRMAKWVTVATWVRCCGQGSCGEV